MHNYSFWVIGQFIHLQLQVPAECLSDSENTGCRETGKIMPQCKSERKQDLGQSLLASEYGIHWRKKRKMVLVSRDKASGLPALLTEATS